MLGNDEGRIMLVLLLFSVLLPAEKVGGFSPSSFSSDPHRHALLSVGTLSNSYVMGKGTLQKQLAAWSPNNDDVLLAMMLKCCSNDRQYEHSNQFCSPFRYLWR